MEPILLTLAIAMACSIAAAVWLLWRSQASAREKGILENTVQNLTLDVEELSETAATVSDLRVANAELVRDLDTARQAAQKAEAHSSDIERKIENLQSKLHRVEVDEGRAVAECKLLRQQIANGEELLKQARESFPGLAAEVLKRESESFRTSAGASIKGVVDPLSKKVSEMVIGEAELRKEIEALEKSAVAVSNETRTLTTALRFQPNVSGELGEMAVESILESLGFVKGRTYFRQETTDAGRLDYRVILASEVEVILEVKTFTKNLIEYEQARSEKDKAKAKNRFVQNIRKEVDEVAKRDYADFVIMAINEGAYEMASKFAPDVFPRAADKQIEVISYATLHSVLQVASLSGKGVKIAKRAQEVKAKSRSLYRRVATLSEVYAKLGRDLETVRKTYNRGSKTLNDDIAQAGEDLRNLGLPAGSAIPSGKQVRSSFRPPSELPEIDALGNSDPTSEDRGANSGDGRVRDSEANPAPRDENFNGTENANGHSPNGHHAPPFDADHGGSNSQSHSEELDDQPAS